MDQEKQTPDLSFVKEDIAIEPLSNGGPMPPKKPVKRRRSFARFIPLIFAASLGLNVFLAIQLLTFKTISSHSVSYDTMVEDTYEMAFSEMDEAYWDIENYIDIDEFTTLAAEISEEVVNDVALQFAYNGIYDWHDIAQLCPYLSQEVVDEIASVLIQSGVLPLHEMKQYYPYMSQSGIDAAALQYVANNYSNWEEFDNLFPHISADTSTEVILQLTRMYPSQAVEIANEFKSYLSQDALDAVFKDLLGI